MMPTKANRTRHPKLASQQTAGPLPAEDLEKLDSAEVNGVIARLTEQLQRENKRIAQLVEKQRKLKQQLLRAQEESLTALCRGPAPLETISNS